MGTRSGGRIALLNERDILQRPAFRAELEALAQRTGRTSERAEAYARECLEEMAVHPGERYLSWIARLARFVTTRSYESTIDVDGHRIDELQAMADHHPLIFLWSHKSYLDGFVFLRILHERNFRPHPLSFAGINMKFPVFGTLAKRSGGIFLRRSFRDDRIYRLVFRRYIDYLVEKRLPLSWAIEGTRSRTGSLARPKLGLIHWVVDSCRRSACDDAMLIPVSISFDQIAEIDEFVSLQRGGVKRKESLGWFVRYVRGMRIPRGRIHVRFAEPVSLSETTNVSAAWFGEDDTEEDIRVKKLAFEVCSRIQRATPVNATDVVTLVVLAANGRALGFEEIRRHARGIVEIINERRLPTAGDLDLETGTDLPCLLAALTATRLLECYAGGREEVYRIRPGQQLAAAYYRNTVVHHFLAAALAELALARIDPVDDGSRSGAFDAAVLGLRDLLKFDFFFREKTAFLREARRYLDRCYPRWLRSPHPFSGKQPLLGPGILRSFIEAYRVLAEVLRHDRDGIAGQPDRLADACLRAGEGMRLRGHIASEAALSKPLFENAIGLATHRGLIGNASADKRQARQAFAGEIVAWHEALERLQYRFDQHSTGVTRPA